MDGTLDFLRGVEHGWHGLDTDLNRSNNPCLIRDIRVPLC